MAIRYYDDILIQKLKRWIPEESRLRVLGPEETKKLFEQVADEAKDAPIALPLIALSRKNDLELLSTVKSPKSYDGLRLIPAGIKTDLSDLTGKAYHEAKANIPDGTYLFNVIPIRPEYQLDIYTKKAEECEEYLRNFLFKLINNPAIKIEIPYHNLNIEHIANIRVLNNVSNTSSIGERIFSGQFTRWTIQFELHDAFLFSIPYKSNWKFNLGFDLESPGELELAPQLNKSGEIEQLNFNITK